MRIKKSKARWSFEILNSLFMLLMIVICLYPIIYILFASLSSSHVLTRLGGKLLFWPVEFSTTAYVRALANPNILSGYKNTLFVLFFGLIVSMLLTIIGAYFLSRKSVAFQKPITLFIMFTMWFHGGLIPLYIAVRDIGLDGNIWSLIIPSAVSTYNMIIMRTGFAAIPSSIEESASIDGAGHLIILFRIMLPLAKATIAVIALYYGVGIWNSWFHAAIFLQGHSDKWPLQLVLRQILIMNDTESMMQGEGVGDLESVGESIKYAVIIIATLPILCVYPFIQKYFVKGVMIGAVKG